MKRFVLTLVLFCLSGLFLAWLTAGFIADIRGYGATEAWGWMLFSFLGPGAAVANGLFLLAAFLADTIWILMFMAWLIQRIFHIKNNENTLFLP